MLKIYAKWVEIRVIIDENPFKSLLKKSPISSVKARLEGSFEDIINEN